MMSATKIPPTTAPAFMLNKHDVQRLLTENSHQVRIDVVGKVAQSYDMNQLSKRELTIVEQIFRALVKDTEISVREALAESLKSNPMIPRDIILSLARDVDSVAIPVLQFSEVFRDEDLISIIQMVKQSDKQIAIASRKKISSQVVDDLVRSKNNQAVRQLVRNAGATIEDKTYSDIVAAYSRDKGVMDAVALRPNLPATIVEKIISLVSESIAKQLSEHYKITPPEVVADNEKSREVATLQLIEGDVTVNEIDRLVDQLSKFQRLMPSIILTALCRGDLYFFEASLAKLSSIPVANAKILIHDKGGLGYKALYAKAELPEKFFAASKLLLEAVTSMKLGQKKADANQLVKRILAHPSAKTTDNLSYMIALIRQNA